MGASKDQFISDREAQESAIPAKKSMFNIRQDHLTLLALIEEADGELTPEMQEDLRLTEEGFKDKAISYGYLIRKLDAESDVIAAEIKRLQSLKQRADKRSELFKQMLDEGMKQFGYDKVESELLKISYRKSTPVELSEGFADSILKYADVSISLSPEKIKEAEEMGETVIVTEEMLSLFDIDTSVSKKRIGDAIKQGVKIPGASMPEKKNLQIK
jgi:hypothetical protein